MLLGGCAQVVQPKGGPKDITPPKVVKYSPGNKSILFHDKKIDITFDEYIQLKDLSKQFIISPPLKNLPVPIVKGRVLEIPLYKDTLLDNTTYTFNFGNAVCDLHEGNAYKNFQYVFSTGIYVDSLSIQGVAMDAFSHTRIKEGLILLYSDLKDSTPYKKNPSYCGQTDDTGRFRIDNMKAGEYNLIALSKGAGDYLYHPYSQSIAFKSNHLHLEKKDSITLFLFTEVQPKLQFLKAKGIGKGEIMLTFNRPADSIKITPTNIDTAKAFTTILQYSATSDTLIYWTNYPDLDSLRFIISQKKTALDTTIVYNLPGHITISSSKKKNKKPEKPPVLQVSLNISSKVSYDYHLPFVMKFEHPVTKFDLSKITLTHGNESIGLKQTGTPSLYNLSLSPEKDLISDSMYHFTILPGAFTDLFGYINDTINTRFRVEEQSFFGSLRVNLTFSRKTHYIIQLLKGDNNVYRQDTTNGATSIFYNGLPPAIYGIRVIEDDNNNGKWDNGNYMKGMQPESVFYYPEQINVRSNWDVTQNWNIK